MKIEEVTCMPLRNNGTLLIKTEVDQPDDSYRYAFYIYKGSETLLKSPYDRRSFIIYKAEAFGKYQIKAFVRNADGSERDNKVIAYVVNRGNARELDQDDANLPPISCVVTAEKSEGNVLTAKVSGDFEPDAQFAWYVYHEDEKEPEFKGPYSSNPMLSYTVQRNGAYCAKAFVKTGRRKVTAKSEPVEM